MTQQIGGEEGSRIVLARPFGMFKLTEVGDSLEKLEVWRLGPGQSGANEMATACSVGGGLGISAAREGAFSFVSSGGQER